MCPRCTGTLATALLSVVAAALLGGCGAEGTARSAGPNGGRPPTLIRVGRIEQRTVAPRIVAVGSVTPRWMSIVASGADGLVADFRIDEGQFVKRGDVLCALRMASTDLEIQEARAVLLERKRMLEELEAGSRPEDIAEAKAKMLSTQAILNNARRKLERAQQLLGQKAINQNDLEDAQERADAAQHAYDATKAAYDRIVAGPRVEEIEQARARHEAQKERVSYLESEKEKRITRAPYDGYVVKNQTFVGQWLSKGDPIVVMAMLELVDVIVKIDQENLQHVQVGGTANVHVSGCRQTDWEGKIVAIVPRSEWQSGSRGFPVEVRLQNRFYEVDGRHLPYLKEGMMAEVTVEGALRDALMIHKDALVRTSTGPVVYTFLPDENDAQTGSVRMIPVEAGISEGTWIQVAGDGLQAGMLVVTEGAERVRPFEKPRLAPATDVQGGPPVTRQADGRRSTEGGNATPPSGGDRQDAG